MLKQRSHLVRLKALQILPDLVGKGDKIAISAAADRLKDWSVDVRRAAVTSLQDIPGEFTSSELGHADPWP
jgi:HEAT repeat protein